MYCFVDDDEIWFFNVEREDLELYLERLSDEDLKEILRYGIGYYYEVLSKLDKKIVIILFEEGVIKVFVVFKVSLNWFFLIEYELN